MRNPVTAFAQWAVTRTSWWLTEMAEIEAARIDNAIDREILRARLSQARRADQKAALEANCD